MIRYSLIRHVLMLSSGLALFPPLAFSQHATGLLEVLTAARVHDPAFRAAAAERKASQYDSQIGRSLFLPSVSATLSQGKAEYDREILNGGASQSQPSSLDLKSQALQIRQPLFNLDFLSRYRSANENVSAAEYRYRLNEYELVKRVASMYVEVLVALEQLKAAQAQTDALTEARNLAERQKAGGEGNRLDVLDAIAKLDLADAQKLEVQLVLETKLRALEGITGLSLLALAQAREGSSIIPKQKLEFSELSLELLANNPEILLARSQVQQAVYQIDRSKAGHAPRLDLLLAQTYSENDTVNTINQKTDSKVIQVQVQIPIFSGFGTQAQVAQSSAKLNQAKAELDDLIQKKQIELRQLVLEANLISSRLRAYEKAMNSAKESLKAAQLGRKAGLRIQLDELNALQQLYDVTKDYHRTRYDTIINLIKVKTLTGSVQYDDLLQMARVFDGLGAEVPPLYSEVQPVSANSDQKEFNVLVNKLQAELPASTLPAEEKTETAGEEKQL